MKTSKCAFISLQNFVDKSLLIQVGDFLILKSDNEPTKNGETKPPLWRVDGKTLIQKYECTDKVNYWPGLANPDSHFLHFQEGVKYKSVNTYSGWTSATRHKYQTVKVKMLKSGGKETLIERLASQPQSEEQTEKKDKEVNR